MRVVHPSLLITDDDANLRETLQDLLEERGYRTVPAEDGEEALRIVKQREIHVVLLDMHMPRLTGLETLRLVKEVRALLPCILMSSELDRSTIEQASQMAFEILAKPFSFRQIDETLRRALRYTYQWHDEWDDPKGAKDAE